MITERTTPRGSIEKINFFAQKEIQEQIADIMKTSWYERTFKIGAKNKN